VPIDRMRECGGVRAVSDRANCRNEPQRTRYCRRKL